MKTFELLSIIGSIAAVGIALGAVVIGSNANLRMEMRDEMHGLRTEMHGLRTELRADIRAVDTRLSAVEQRQARTEGLLEGLRDVITARSLQEPPPRNEPARSRDPVRPRPSAAEGPDLVPGVAAEAPLATREL